MSQTAIARIIQIRQEAGGMPLTSGWLIQLEISGLNDGIVIDQFLFDAVIDDTDSPSEVNRKLVAAIQQALLTDHGITVASRNILLLGGAV